jgi:hypothetical protein
MSEGRFVIATCPLCGHQLIFDETLPNYTAAYVASVGEAHLKTHSPAEWANAVQALKQEREQLDDLRAMPRCAMPRA